MFLFSAIFLFTGSLFFFGLTDIFEKKSYFVSFFSESVRGLSTGSIVRFRGVEIGQVNEVKLSLGPDITGEGIPVTYELDISRLQNKLGVTTDLTSEDYYHNAIKDGLSAKLDSGSILTGQLYIDLDFRPNQVKKTQPWVIKDDLFYIPSVPSLRSNVTDQMLKIVNDISQIDFPGLSTNLNNLLISLNSVAVDFKASDVPENLNATITSVRTLLDSGDLQKMLNQITQTAGTLDGMISDLNDGQGSLGGPLAKTLSNLATTMASFDKASMDFANLIRSADGPVAGLEQTLNEVQQTMAALQSLLDFLRRHPNALIFGKQQP